jgi:NAD(P)-dependent dehydrogenase (short-subunit alcohol dehydrogenase family)
MAGNSPSTVLITGANRGLGLEFARQYAAAGWRVHAACREPKQALELAELEGEVHVHKLDVTHARQVAALARELDDQAIDVLIDNAGMGEPDRGALGDIDYDAWEAVLRVNVLGALRVAEAFTDHVARSSGKTIVGLSSRLGSIGLNSEGGRYVYRSSKAALNAALRSLAGDLRDRGVIVVAMSPGWVKTDMGGPSAPLAPEKSIAGMREVIGRLTLKDSGRFLDYAGEEIPW